MASNNIKEKAKQLGIVFSFMDQEIKDEKEIFLQILDPIREKYPLLANTRLYRNNSCLLLNYRVDNNLFLKSEYNDIRLEYKELIKSVSVIEEDIEKFQRINAVRPKRMHLREFHEILKIFRKVNYLDLIIVEKNILKKKELITKFISSEKTLDRNKTEKILLQIPRNNFVLQNHIYKELSEKAPYDYDTIEKWHYELRDVEKKKETRKELIMSYEILEKNDVLSPKEFRDAILIYNVGVWKEEPIEVLDKIIIEYLEEKVWDEWNKKKKRFDKVKQKINVHTINILTRIIIRKTQCSIKDFDTYDYHINVKNGIIDFSDINNIKFFKHSRLFLNRIQIPVIYDEKTECPNIEKFINEILEAKYIDLMYEFLGDCLTGKVTYQKALLFTGEGANGKSTLIELFREFMGFDNCSSTPLQKLLEDKFATANLENILLNLAADIPRKALNYTEVFKQVVGDRTLMGEKKFRKEYEFYNHSKHIFSCNIVPPTYDNTHAFYRRWIIVPFIRTFQEEEQESQDKLIKKITSEKELSGFLNKILAGLRSLEKRGHYKKEYSMETEAQWELFSNPLLQFVENYIDINDTPGIDEKYEIKKANFLRIYNIFLKKHKQPEIKGTNTLTGKINYLKGYKDKIKNRAYQENGIKKHVYTNIKFNEKAKKDFKIEAKEDEKSDNQQSILSTYEKDIDFSDPDRLFTK